MKVDHIGYLCRDIQKSLSVFEKLGYKKISEIIIDNEANGDIHPRNVNICFIENDGIRIELVSPMDENSDVTDTLKRQGEGPYHICYRTTDLELLITDMKKNGWIVIKKPAKAKAFDYARVAFLYKNGAGLVELVELEE